MLTAARLPLDATTQVGIRREAKRWPISQSRKFDGVPGIESREPTLMWATVQPKVDLHRKPGILHRPMRLAGASKLDLAANGVQRSTAADAE